MDDRDQLAALIWRWMSDNNDDYVENPDDPGCDVADVRIDATLDLTKLAGAILAAGWQAPEPNPCAHTSQSRVGDTSQWICNQCGDVDERGGAYA